MEHPRSWRADRSLGAAFPPRAFDACFPRLPQATAEIESSMIEHAPEDVAAPTESEEERPESEEVDVWWKIGTALAVLIAVATLAQSLRVFG